MTNLIIPILQENGSWLASVHGQFNTNTKRVETCQPISNFPVLKSTKEINSGSSFEWMPKEFKTTIYSTKESTVIESMDLGEALQVKQRMLQNSLI